MKLIQMGSSKIKSLTAPQRALSLAQRFRKIYPDAHCELDFWNAFGKNEGIVVDTHVIRLSQRFKLTKNGDAEKIERDLMKIVPQRDWTLWSHWLIWHGRRRCFARKPDCANCEVFALCPSGRIFLRKGEAKKA